MQSWLLNKKNPDEQEILEADAEFGFLDYQGNKEEEDLYALPKLVASIWEATHWTPEVIMNQPLAPLLMVFDQLKDHSDEVQTGSSGEVPIEQSLAGVLAQGPPDTWEE